MSEDDYGQARAVGARAAERMVRDIVAGAPDVRDGHYGSVYARLSWLADALAAASATVDAERRDAWSASCTAWNIAREGTMAADPAGEGSA